jgi:hypothetical protein
MIRIHQLGTGHILCLVVHHLRGLFYQVGLKRRTLLQSARSKGPRTVESFTELTPLTVGEGLAQ